MALTAELQSQLEMQLAIENVRHTNHSANELLRVKLEVVRVAQQTLIENRRNQPVDQREVTATDITAYATTLMNFINN